MSSPRRIAIALLALTTLGRAFPAEPYTWRNVAIGGGGFVTGLVYHPTQPGLLYARTDVGGAYRSEDSGRTWTPLLDGFGRADLNLQGIESLAVDPADPRHLYLAAGTYTAAWAPNGEILHSDDKGRTWQRVPVPIKFGANEAGRNSGERLAVDPNYGRIVFLGTRNDGLWRSADRGESWKPVKSFPVQPGDRSTRDTINPAQTIGVIWIRFEPGSGRPGQPTPLLYAAVSRPTDGLLRSKDAGATWESLPGQPKGLRPTAATLAPGGTLYVTYGDDPGPNRMLQGAVWKCNLRSEKWSEITPERPAALDKEAPHFGYGAVALDPANANTVLVATWNRWSPRDGIFRSTDAGATWRPVLEKSDWDHTSAPYTATLTPHWLSSIAIDPRGGKRVLFATGFGVWATEDITASDHGEITHWSFSNRGIEETVPLALASPPEGAQLVSGLGDIDGFRHDDLAVSPAGRFPGPRFKNTECLDFAEQRPALFVRAGTPFNNSPIHGAWSQDGAATWQAFASEPPRAAGEKTDETGPITISADGAVLVWTLPRQIPYRSTDRGASWQPTSGAPADMVPVADRVDAKLFFGYDVAKGNLLASHDGGANFTVVRSGLPQTSSRWTMEMHTVPAHSGELWLAVNGQLFHLTREGRSLDKFDALREVASVGLGRPAQGSENSTVFVVAKLGKDDGIFRSDDLGKTWIRLTDSGHLFGSARTLTGDPRVFGRVYFSTSGRGIVYGDPTPP